MVPTIPMTVGMEFTTVPAKKKKSPPQASPADTPAPATVAPSDTAPSDTAPSDVVKSDTAQSNAVKSDAVRSDSVKSKKSTTVKSGSAKSGSGKSNTVHQAPDESQLTEGTQPKDSEWLGLPFPVVGIGASAGGLDAFKRFFTAMPADSGMAFILIPHLDPSHRSLMVELLARQTTMPVREAKMGMPIEPNSVYVIPPNKLLTVQRGQLQLARPPERQEFPTALDGFFRSLAKDQQERAVGIILSGTGNHGTTGLREIKAAGGMVMAQDPATAEYNQMPQSAVDTALVDYSLAPEHLPAALLSYVHQPYLRVDKPASSTPITAEQIAPVLDLLRTHSRYDFRCYRKNMLIRRIQRRVGICQVDDIPQYVEYLAKHPSELTALYRDLLIGVTSFFRDPEAFRTLQEQVITELVAKQSGETPIRVWVPACSTGEEAYSIAMLLIEQFAAMNKPANFQIFASDIDEQSLDAARRGIYPASAVAELSPERVQHFFMRVNETHYQVTKQLRACLVVTRQNLISDAPFSKLNLISCRNLLIYLEPELQQKIIALFHFGLSERGYLFLGCSESIGRQTELFEPVSRKWRISQRIGPVRPKVVHVPAVAEKEQRMRFPNLDVNPRPKVGYPELMQKQLLTRFAPAAVLINRKYEVLSLFGRTSDYLELPSGELTHDLMSLARQGLRTKIRSACHKLLSSGEFTTTTIDARVSRNKTSVICTVTVSLLNDSKETNELLLITFQDREEDPETHVPPTLTKEDESAIVAQLEHEVESTREDLQSTIEELQSSNEEVMSMNEEMQSANEELETSKEELQSFNEELSTVNSQLQDKVDELERANSDIRNLLNSTEIATVFLDTDLRIRRFTPATRQLLNLIESDIGRPIRDFALRFTDKTLMQDAGRVLDQHKPVETVIRSEAGLDYLRRILPYRTNNDRIEGVVLTFVDITERKRIETALAESEHRMRTIVETAADAIITMTENGIIDSFNPAAERMFGYTRDEAIGQNISILMPTPHHDEHDHVLSRYKKSGTQRFTGLGRELIGQRKDGSTFPIDLAFSELCDGVAQSFTCIIRDISERKSLQSELLTIASEEKLRISQDLHDSVGQKLTGLAMLAGSLAETLQENSPADVDVANRIAIGVEKTLEQIRKLSRGLLPVEVDAEGLRAALTELSDVTADDSGVQCDFQCAQTVRVEDNETATHLYRIAQEATANALKHGAPTQVTISLTRDETHLILCVEDDGQGISPSAWQATGMGLKTMQYRADLIGATLSINPLKDGGTRVTCRLAENGKHARTDNDN